MSKYEELYYTAKNRYNQAVETRNSIQRTTADLQSRKSNLSREVSQAQANLRDLKNKVAILSDAENKCRSILNEEFAQMKNYISKTSEEYTKILSSDMGVANIQEIYDDDLCSTQNSLNSILTELENKRKGLEEEASSAQNLLDSRNNELNDVSARLRSVGNIAYAQNQINIYYAQMQEYKKKWEADR